MRVSIRQRTRVFAGCEGKSERAYVRWLQERADQRSLPIFFDSADLGGGDPLAIVQKAVKVARHNERFKSVYAAKMILLDEDRIGECGDRDALIQALVDRNNFDLIFQSFDHEALLLRHFDGCCNLRPPRRASIDKLRKRWPEYTKPAQFMDLEKRLDDAALVRALGVEPLLRKFLNGLGF